MTPLVPIFLGVVSFSLGLWVGWYLRSRPESAPAEDPEIQLRELREIHADCATRIRSLHLELAQLESIRALAGVDLPRLESAQTAPDGEAPTSAAGSARLASLIDALGSQRDRHDIEDDHGPPAFMSILPSNLVEEAVREPADDESAPALDGHDGDTTPEDVPDRAGVDAVGVAGRASGEPPPGDSDVDAYVPPARIGPAEEEVIISLSSGSVDEGPEIEVGRRDDLTTIRGIGPKIEAILHEQGITTFRQIAEMDELTIARLGDALGAFRGRIERDDWVGSARELIAESAVSR